MSDTGQGITLRAAAGSRGAMAAASAAGVAPAGFDSASMEKFADRVGTHIKDSGAGGASVDNSTTIHVHNQGLISPDNMNKVIKKINHMVQNRQATLKASDSLRVTRRSQ